MLSAWLLVVVFLVNDLRWDWRETWWNRVVEWIEALLFITQQQQQHSIESINHKVYANRKFMEKQKLVANSWLRKLNRQKYCCSSSSTSRLRGVPGGEMKWSEGRGWREIGTIKPWRHHRDHWKQNRISMFPQQQQNRSNSLFTGPIDVKTKPCFAMIIWRWCCCCFERSHTNTLQFNWINHKKCGFGGTIFEKNTNKNLDEWTMTLTRCFKPGRGERIEIQSRKHESLTREDGTKRKLCRHANRILHPFPMLRGARYVGWFTLHRAWSEGALEECLLDLDAMNALLRCNSSHCVHVPRRQGLIWKVDTKKNIELGPSFILEKKSVDIRVLQPQNWIAKAETMKLTHS